MAAKILFNDQIKAKAAIPTARPPKALGNAVAAAPAIGAAVVVALCTLG